MEQKQNGNTITDCTSFFLNNGKPKLLFIA